MEVDSYYHAGQAGRWEEADGGTGLALGGSLGLVAQNSLEVEEGSVQSSVQVQSRLEEGEEIHDHIEGDSSRDTGGVGGREEGREIRRGGFAEEVVPGEARVWKSSR